MFQDNVKTLRDFYGAVAQGDCASVMLDPQIEWIEPDVPDLWFSGTHYGPYAVLKEVIEPASEKFDAFHMQCDQFFDTGDQVIVTGHFQGRKRDGCRFECAFCSCLDASRRQGRAVPELHRHGELVHALYRLHVEHRRKCQ